MLVWIFISSGGGFETMMDSIIRSAHSSSLVTFYTNYKLSSRIYTTFVH